MNTKSVEQWEQEKKIALRGDEILQYLGEQVTEDKFENLMAQYGFTGVDYFTRIDWLNNNGYDLTRANLIDVNLSSKPTIEDTTLEVQNSNHDQASTDIGGQNGQNN